MNRYKVHKYDLVNGDVIISCPMIDKRWMSATKKFDKCMECHKDGVAQCNLCLVCLLLGGKHGKEK